MYYLLNEQYRRKKTTPSLWTPGCFPFALPPNLWWVTALFPISLQSYLKTNLKSPCLKIKTKYRHPPHTQKTRPITQLCSLKNNNKTPRSNQLPYISRTANLQSFPRENTTRGIKPTCFLPRWQVIATNPPTSANQGGWVGILCLGDPRDRGTWSPRGTPDM